VSFDNNEFGEKQSLTPKGISSAMRE